MNLGWRGHEYSRVLSKPEMCSQKNVKAVFVYVNLFLENGPDKLYTKPFESFPYFEKTIFRFEKIDPSFLKLFAKYKS